MLSEAIETKYTLLDWENYPITKCLDLFVLQIQSNLTEEI